jgi:hypothetical protein
MGSLYTEWSHFETHFPSSDSFQFKPELYKPDSIFNIPTTESVIIKAIQDVEEQIRKELQFIPLFSYQEYQQRGGVGSTKSCWDDNHFKLWFRDTRVNTILCNNEELSTVLAIRTLTRECKEFLMTVSKQK